MPDQLTPAEPWLRGIRLAVDPVVEPVLFALQQVREDLSSLNAQDLWREIPGIPPLGFQLRHIAGSLDRLVTYLKGETLTPAQLTELAAEQNPGPSAAELLQAVDQSIRRAESAIATLNPLSYPETRHVGRRRIPTTVIGLAVHIAEHSQRHCGQAITTAKLMSGLPHE